MIYGLTIWYVKYTIKSFNLIKSIPQILRPRFWNGICPFLMILFQSKFSINMTILILKLSISSCLDGDVPHSTPYGVYISQLIRFARASSPVDGVNICKKPLTHKLLKQGYWSSLRYIREQQCQSETARVHIHRLSFTMSGSSNVQARLHRCKPN